MLHNYSKATTCIRNAPVTLRWSPANYIQGSKKHLFSHRVGENTQEDKGYA